MKKRVTPLLALIGGTAAILAAFTHGGGPQPTPEGAAAASNRVIEVRMIEKSATSFAFEPAEITVTPGDVVRFVQAGDVPHNVEFRDRPGDASIADIAMGPFLIQKGQTYEVEIDGRFAEGVYDYVCTPHEVMGMVGRIRVGTEP